MSPLHLAAGTPGEEGILITEYLLNALSDPDARATADNSYLDPDDEFGKEDEVDTPHSLGRTPLHIACSRDDDYEVLLEYTLFGFPYIMHSLTLTILYTL